MFENAKRLKEMQKEINRQKQYLQQNEQSDILKVKIDQKEDLLSRYSLQNFPILNPELCDFVEEKIDYKEMQKELNIELYVKDLEDHELTLYEEAFTNTYTDKVIRKTKELKRNKCVSLVFLICGLIVFISSIILKRWISHDVSILFESIDIMGWVFIWEAVDLFFIARKVLTFEQIRYYKILKAKFSIKKE